MLLFLLDWLVKPRGDLTRARRNMLETAVHWGKTNRQMANPRLRDYWCRLRGQITTA